MKINVRNNAQLPKKYVRFIKWKCYRFRTKFKQLIYAEIFLNSEGQSPKIYSATVRLGIPGNDIIIQNKSTSLKEVFRRSTKDIHRYLARNKQVKTK